MQETHHPSNSLIDSVRGQRGDPAPMRPLSGQRRRHLSLRPVLRPERAPGDGLVDGSRPGAHELGGLLDVGGVARSAVAASPPYTVGASSASAPAPLVQLAPAAALITAAMAAPSRTERRWDRISQPASAAMAGSMLSSTP
jgi:hypothetical protein